jgi:hypothetical protein
LKLTGSSRSLHLRGCCLLVDDRLSFFMADFHDTCDGNTEVLMQKILASTWPPLSGAEQPLNPLNFRLDKRDHTMSYDPDPLSFSFGARIQAIFRGWTILILSGCWKRKYRPEIEFCEKLSTAPFERGILARPYSPHRNQTEWTWMIALSGFNCLPFQVGIDGFRLFEFHRTCNGRNNQTFRWVVSKLKSIMY